MVLNVLHSHLLDSSCVRSELAAAFWGPRCSFLLFHFLEHITAQRPSCEQPLCYLIQIPFTPPQSPTPLSNTHTRGNSIHTGSLADAVTLRPSGLNLRRQRSQKAAVSAKCLIQCCTCPSLSAMATPGRSLQLVQELRANRVVSTSSRLRCSYSVRVQETGIQDWTISASLAPCMH